MCLELSASTEGRTAGLCCWAPYTLGAHSQYFPQGREIRHSPFVGETSTVQTWEERALTGKDSGEAVLRAIGSSELEEKMRIVTSEQNRSFGVGLKSVQAGLTGLFTSFICVLSTKVRLWLNHTREL